MKQTHRPPAAILLAAVIAVAPGCRKTPPLASGIDVAGMDTSVAPGDDFNAYTNGGWIKATPIPADKPSYGLFEKLADETRKRVQTLVQEAAQAGSAGGEDARKIADFYASFMDEAAIEAKGIAPLKPQFDADCGYREPARSRPRAGRAAARGCRPAEQHEFPDL